MAARRPLRARRGASGLCRGRRRDRASCPLYDGLTLRPQLGLVPLDRNPETGLWEFWHPQSGARPRPASSPAENGANLWTIGEETGLVFVLVPGGKFRMGAMRPPLGVVLAEKAEGILVESVTAGSLAARAGIAPGDLLRSVGGIPLARTNDLANALGTLRTGEAAAFVVERGGNALELSATVELGIGSPNIDPLAEGEEAPVHEVDLAPYFLSKYEMTQGQWNRAPAAERSPSFYGVGFNVEGRIVHGAHPVESVTWGWCEQTLRRLGLSLPTEAQWERGSRGGMETPSWSGSSISDLAGCANVADLTASRSVPSWNSTKELDDGFVLHAPVGTYRANPFGLHDTLGNVWEWCADAFENYTTPAASGSGLRGAAPDASVRMVRGGGYGSPATRARSAYRDETDPENRNNSRGVRPARRLEE